ncbi:4Fe-4S dicluster domain-containing protein [Selenomonadales bacterium OttesenSCG-928-I06]|nr:4Fe-4S dicluster domain-containing protein [Selenomonadales bacterium OttesenSCG-928-I06]
MEYKEQSSFALNLEKKSHQPISSCFQCAKCTIECPMNGFQEHKNYEILHLIKLGDENTVYNSSTPYFCTNCKTCATRCPNGIDISKVLDTIKIKAKAKNRVPKRGENSSIFSELFLKSMQGIPLFGGEGRSYELLLMALYKLKTKNFFADAALGKELFKRNKLPFLPHNAIKIRKGEVKNIFKIAKERQEK